jgi:asparagine synthase (glutamine-hydrolysing)
MCGISGFLDLEPHLSRDEMIAIAAAMAARVAHRGPDGRGIWVDAPAGISFGHTRLSIVDVSTAGAQPMVSGSGRFVINYNGEVYNAPDLARELRGSGVRFRGHSDTEVLVEAIEHWGLDRTLDRANGMFAFACWDRADRRLHLVRDRLGEKPLYYGWRGSTLLFGSELAALRAHPKVSLEVDRSALASYLRFAAVPAPASIYEGISKLPPASILTVAAVSSATTATPREYWSAFGGFTHTSSDATDPQAAVDALDPLLRDAVRIRMRSDVPLGAFLSGGIDSTTVVALMQDQSATPVRTFTIGSTSRTYNEADAAHAVASHLGTRHTELVVTAADAQAVIPKLPEIYDEPFADSSQIPTYLVAELARHDVTVSLSGDGGDETFGGYNRYRHLPRALRRNQRIPLATRQRAARVLDGVPPVVWERLAGLVPASKRPRIPATKVGKLAALTRLDSPAAMYAELATHWNDLDGVLVDGVAPRTLVDRPDEWPPVPELENLLMALDTVTFLPDDILVKLDRATMAVGLEGRVPLLDHRVVEFGATLPAAVKLRDGCTKWPLRALLARYVPDDLVDRPKSGFGIPIGNWLRGALRPWADELLAPDRLRREGYFRPEPIRAMWDDHLRRTHDWEYHLWDVLMFQAWLEHTASASAAPGVGDYVVISE